MKIDVVIPTLDRYNCDFKKTLSSISVAMKKAGCKSNYIIVGPEVRGRGKSRDVGWRRGSSKYILFVDDGVILSSNWMIKMINLMDEIKGDVFYGDDSKAENDFNMVARYCEIEYTSYSDRLKNQGNYVKMKILNTSNCLFTRKSLEKVNGFDVNLPFCEDSEIGFRLWKHGFNIIFNSDAKCTNNHRTTIFGKLQQSWQFGTGLNYIRYKHPSFPVKWTIYLLIYYSTFKNIYFWGRKYGRTGVVASILYFFKRIAVLLGFLFASFGINKVKI